MTLCNFHGLRSGVIRIQVQMLIGTIQTALWFFTMT
jgi:hypothetical protein